VPVKETVLCHLDGNEKTLKEVSGLEWITRDSCCASANFLGQLLLLLFKRSRGLKKLLLLLPTPTESVGVGRMFGSIRLSVCMQHNSKTNDPKVFKFGIGNDLWIS